MQEFIDKLIGRLEEKLGSVNFEKATKEVNESFYEGMAYAYGESIEIIKELAEQHKVECVKVISEVDKEKLDSLHKKILKNNKMLEIVTEEEINALIQSKQHNNGWINCSSGNMPSNGQEVYVEFKDGQHMCLIYRTEDSRKKSDGWEMNITQDGFYEICSDYGWKPYRNIVAWHPLPPAYKEGGV